MSIAATAPKAPAPEIDDALPADVKPVPTPKKINWGGVIKGVLVVTAVVAVGFVGFHFASGAAASIMAKSTVAQGAVAGISNAVSWVAGVAGTAWGALSGTVESLWTASGASGAFDSAWNWGKDIFDAAWNGIASMFTPAIGNALAAQTSVATKTAGWLGAGAVTLGAAVPVAKGLLADTHLVVPDTHAMHQQVTNGKLGLHAAEHHEKASTDWQTKVGGPRPAPVAAIKTAPAASHTEKLLKDAEASKSSAASLA